MIIQTSKKLVFVSVFLLLFASVSAQTADTISLSRAEAEAVFLEKNIDLIGQKLEISQAEARVMQSKLWPNPTLTVDEINLWRTWNIEKQPPLIGNWGTNSQIAVEIEQVIQTAGKRRKNIELAQIEVDGKQFEFQEVLRELKKKLRNHLNEVLFIQQQQKIFQQQIASIQKLTQAYQNQYHQGNISKAEYIRLKAQEIEFRKSLVSLQQQMEGEQSELKQLLILPPESYLKITDELNVPAKLISEQQLNEWFEIAQKNRPDILIAQNEEKYARKNLELQKALKTPDLAFKVEYDRGGNIMKDFVGVGVSFDLPVFNRNKGNIQEAGLQVERSGLEIQKALNNAKTEIITAVRNYVHTEQMIHSIKGEYGETMDILLGSYEKNFRSRNISMLEYLDFLEAYINSKTILLETQKELCDYLEELQYTIGQDL